MKMPEHSRTSGVGNLLVLLLQNMLFDAIIWHHMTSWHHTLMSHAVTSQAISLRWDQKSVHSAQNYVMKFYLVTLTFWPTTLIYNPTLAKVKVNSHMESQGHSSNDSAVRVVTHRDTQKHSSNSMTSTADAGGNNWALCLVPSEWYAYDVTTCNITVCHHDVMWHHIMTSNNIK